MNKLLDKIEQYGGKLDQLIDAKDYAKIKVLLDEMEQFTKIDETVNSNVAMNYYLGTGFGTYSDSEVRGGKKNTDIDVVELRRRAMFYFRRGIQFYNLEENRNPRLFFCLMTNYANLLDTAGRVLEALRIYRIVLDMNNNFSIALGNYGRALRFLGNIVNDNGHYHELHRYAYRAVKKALSIDDPDKHDQANNAFGKLVDEYEKLPNIDLLAKPIVYDDYELGDTVEEIEYRKWCLNNHLFLNPMNEVRDVESAFAHDPLTITTYTEDICAVDSVTGNPAEPPRWFAMLNQLKEEYVYARYLCFSGLEKRKDVHFADKNVTLSQASYDDVGYSIRLEQMKSSYRTLYSMLDQICFFVNDFWQLGFDERKADAFHICKAQNYPQNNIVLMALYWVLCEFFEKFGDAETESEKELAIVRNAFEHKYVKMHETAWTRKLQLECDRFYHVSEADFMKNTIRLMEISREALFYLVYAIGMEERKKDKSEEAVSLFVSDFLDEWKR